MAGMPVFPASDTDPRRRPLIFDQRRFALDDGPGIRTTVFLKGCPLACLWCQNPEGMEPAAELFYRRGACIGCGDCARVCPKGAIHETPAVRVDRGVCDRCGRCVAVCPGGALLLKGVYLPPEVLARRLAEDKVFFDASGGGVTFSGGEPTLFMDYLCRAMLFLKRQHIHIAIQTCGLFDWKLFSGGVLPLADLIYYDIKCVHSEHHRRLTGRGNKLILENFFRLMRKAPHKVVCTVPIVPGLTDQPDELSAIARLIGAFSGLPYQLHPFHPAGHVKASALGKPSDPRVPAVSAPPLAMARISADFATLVTG